MSDTDTADTVEASEPADGRTAEATGPTEEPKPTTSGTDWKAEARKWEARAKENRTAAEKLAELEEAKKSDADKAADRLSKAEKKAADAEAGKAAAELRALRLEVAAEKGLSAKQASRLQGETREELASDAEALLEEFGPAGLVRQGRPQERLHTGGDPTRPPEEMDPAKLAAQVPRGW